MNPKSKHLFRKDINKHNKMTARRKTDNLQHRVKNNTVHEIDKFTQIFLNLLTSWSSINVATLPG